jgi:hypothetical protein
MMKLKQKSKIGLLLILFCCPVFFASAQKVFKYQAPVITMDSTGFYKISLQPGFVAKGRGDLFDLRLVDSSGNFVPYVAARNLPRFQKAQFVSLPHIDLKAATDTGTTFIVENNTKTALSTIWVRLKNTAVKRTVNLSGSDDLKKWFAIEEEIPLENDISNNDDNYLQSLTFPASNYRYLKLLVNDKNKTRLKFLEAGVYTEISPSDLFFPIPKQAVAKKDSNNITYVTIRLNDAYLVNKIHLDISAPKYYKREVSVFDADGNGIVDGFEINSTRPADIFLSAKTTTLKLQITNRDNLPLKISDVKLYQDDEFIIGYLEAGMKYHLVTGNDSASAPDYDLKDFTDSIRSNIPTITHGPVIKNAPADSPVKTEKTDHAAIIWISIFAALLLLSLLTWKMLAEVTTKTRQK